MPTSSNFGQMPPVATTSPELRAARRAAAAMLALQGKVIAALSPSPQTAGQIAAAAAVETTDQTEDGLPAARTPGGQRQKKQHAKALRL